MLIRISLIVAIVAGLGVGVLNFVKIKEKVTTLISERDSEKGQKEEAQASLRKTTKELDQTKTDLTQTKQTLETTTVEKDKAVAEAASQLKRATQLAEDLGKAKKERSDALADLESYKGTGKTPIEILALDKQLQKTQDGLTESLVVNKELDRQNKKLQFKLDKYEGKITIVYLDAKIKGKILVSDPKWDFVVLDIGESQGVLESGEMLVSREGRLVAKVVVRSVQKDRCIANVMPGWKLGEVLEGDQVVPAHPRS